VPSFGKLESSPKSFSAPSSELGRRSLATGERSDAVETLSPAQSFGSRTRPALGEVAECTSSPSGPSASVSPSGSTSSSVLPRRPDAAGAQRFPGTSVGVHGTSAPRDQLPPRFRPRKGDLDSTNR
jgi:hypothetical protein